MYKLRLKKGATQKQVEAVYSIIWEILNRLPDNQTEDELGNTVIEYKAGDGLHKLIIKQVESLGQDLLLNNHHRNR